MNDRAGTEACDAACTATLVELVRRTSTDLPVDVVAALRRAGVSDAADARACGVLRVLQENVALAREASTPLCQDTGLPAFFWRTPPGSDHVRLERCCRAAVTEATRLGYLRRNTIDGLTGASVDTNVAPGGPVCHFEQHAVREPEVWLLLKGGGSENMSAQYSLPDGALHAGRDLAGVRACLLDAVCRAQGAGCAPGILGVCIGSDRAEGYIEAKRQLLRRLDDRAPEAALAHLEAQILNEANSLGIGPMGTGGRSTLLGVKITARCRLPASFFVSIAYMCWACRRRGVVFSPDGTAQEWLGS